MSMVFVTPGQCFSFLGSGLLLLCSRCHKNKAVWEGMEGACAIQQGSNVEQAFLEALYSGELGSCPH